MELKVIDHQDTLFAESNAKSNVFWNPAWQNIFGDKVQTYGVFKGLELLASFQILTYRRFGKTFITHPPFSANCGFTRVRKSENHYIAQSELKRILRKVAEFFADKSNADFVDVVFPPEIIDMQPFIWAGFKAEPKYSYWLSTDSTPEKIYANMSAERKKNIRDAQAVGYELSINNQPDAVRALIDDSMKNTSVNFDSDHLEGILNGDDSWRFWTLVSRNGIALAATLVVYDREKAWYVAGGYDHSAGDSIAGTWALWNAILEVKKRGIQCFDFNGSSIESIEKYFRGFGGELKPSFRIVNRQGMIGQLRKIKNQLKIK